MNPSTDTEVKAVQTPSLVDAISNHNTSNSDESADNLMSELFKATYLTTMITNNMNIIDGIAQEGSTFGCTFRFMAYRYGFNWSLRVP